MVVIKAWVLYKEEFKDEPHKHIPEYEKRLSNRKSYWSKSEKNYFKSTCQIDNITNLLFFAPIYTPITVEIHASSWKKKRKETWAFSKSFKHSCFSFKSPGWAVRPFLLSQRSPASTSFRPFKFSIGTTWKDTRQISYLNTTEVNPSSKMIIICSILLLNIACMVLYSLLLSKWGSYSNRF